MAEQDSTTKTPPEERKTCFTCLSDAIGLALEPVKAFHELLYENADDGELERTLLVFKSLLDKQKAELKKIYEVIDRTLGRISLETPKYHEVVEFGGREFKCEEFIRAIVEPVKPQAEAQGGES